MKKGIEMASIVQAIPWLKPPALWFWEFLQGIWRLAYLMAVAITWWDSHMSPAQKGRALLWAVGMVTLASTITLLMEIAFGTFQKSNDFD